MECQDSQEHDVDTHQYIATVHKTSCVVSRSLWFVQWDLREWNVLREEVPDYSDLKERINYGVWGIGAARRTSVLVGIESFGYVLAHTRLVKHPNNCTKFCPTCSRRNWETPFHFYFLTRQSSVRTFASMSLHTVYREPRHLNQRDQIFPWIHSHGSNSETDKCSTVCRMKSHLKLETVTEHNWLLDSRKTCTEWERKKRTTPSSPEKHLGFNWRLRGNKPDQHFEPWEQSKHQTREKLSGASPQGKEYADNLGAFVAPLSKFCNIIHSVVRNSLWCEEARMVKPKLVRLGLDANARLVCLNGQTSLVWTQGKGEMLLHLNKYTDEARP